MGKDRRRNRHLDLEGTSLVEGTDLVKAGIDRTLGVTDLAKVEIDLILGGSIVPMTYRV